MIENFLSLMCEMQANCRVPHPRRAVVFAARVELHELRRKLAR